MGEKGEGREGRAVVVVWGVSWHDFSFVLVPACLITNQIHHLPFVYEKKRPLILSSQQERHPSFHRPLPHPKTQSYHHHHSPDFHSPPHTPAVSPRTS